MKLSRFVVGISLPLLMAGCASVPGTTYYLSELESVPPEGTPFTQALAREYQAFAEADRTQYAWVDSWYFSKKGLTASHGAAVAPEVPEAWKIPPESRDGLAAGHQRLLSTLAGSAPSRLPALTATAQVKFDCWVEKLSKPWQAEAIAACGRDFLAALDAIDRLPTGFAVPAPAAAPSAAAASSVVTPVLPGTPVAPAKPPARKAEPFEVTFAVNSDRPDAASGPLLTAIAKAAQTAGYPRLTIIGFTDASGNRDSNQRLALRRAEAVRKALIAAGVPADRLTAEGHGVDETASGPDAAAESRRAVVRFPH